MNWLVSLNGNRQVLYGMANFMSSPHFSVYEDSDDHQAEAYFLHFPHIQGNENLTEVVSAIKGLIQLINGALAIDYGFNKFTRYGQISVDRLFSSDRDYPSESDWSQEDFSNQVPASNPFIGNEERSKFDAPFKYKTTAYIQLCSQHEDVFNLLRQASVGFDWRNLYCIWDTICHYSGGQKNAISTLGLDEVKVKAFTGTANNFGVLGIEARHGVKGWAIPNETVDLNGAIDTIDDIVSKYLSKNYCLGCKKKEWEQVI
ncbi:hypothetical protein QQ215_004661 [Vibrio vulnificus]|nr:hypothetical protein [Vibrio vulnificus]ELS0763847.1 hypothetical protein [Vibrio vulnificus]ELV8609858.1 hypothetical protein [Vibrio vulnificus]ELV8618608.1 hypothetical protein [Vibrio vulnificus]